jgi:Bacterial PH domain
MEGVSQPPTARIDVPAPVTATPRRMRIACAVTAVVVFAVRVGVALALKSTTDTVVNFRTSDQVALVVLGALLGGGVLLLGRSRVDADADGVRVRNILGRHQLAWSSVRAVRFDRQSPWASLLLTNDDELSVLAVQATDKERAVRAVEGMRALLAAARAAEPPKPPLLYDD